MIEKSICIPGNVFVVNNKVSVDNDHFGWSKKEGNGLNAYKGDIFGGESSSFQIPVGEKIEIVAFKQGTVSFKYNNEIYFAWWNGLRIKLDKVEGQDIVIPEEKLRYKIYKDGKPLKPKYFNDMGKVKSSLLIAIGYYNNQWRTFEEYKDRNPELQDNQIPEWFSYGGDFKREDCESIEIMSFLGKSKVPVKTDFNVLEYYDQSMKLINVTAQFGSAARELYKKTMVTGEFSYMLVYAPDEYRDKSNIDSYGYNRFDFSVLKESQRIKDVMKASKVKGTKKCTKWGKTAIVFKSLDDLKKVMLRLTPKEYFILDSAGDQLVEKNTRFIKLIMLQKVRDEQED